GEHLVVVRDVHLGRRRGDRDEDLLRPAATAAALVLRGALVPARTGGRAARRLAAAAVSVLARAAAAVDFLALVVGLEVAVMRLVGEHLVVVEGIHLGRRRGDRHEDLLGPTAVLRGVTLVPARPGLALR